MPTASRGKIRATGLEPATYNRQLASHPSALSHLAAPRPPGQAVLPELRAAAVTRRRFGSPDLASSARPTGGPLADLFRRWKSAPPAPLLMAFPFLLFAKSEPGPAWGRGFPELAPLLTNLDIAAQSGSPLPKFTNDALTRLLDLFYERGDLLIKIRNHLASEEPAKRLLGLREMITFLVADKDHHLLKRFTELWRTNYFAEEFSNGLREETTQLLSRLRQLKEREPAGWLEQRRQNRQVAALVAAQDFQALGKLAAQGIDSAMRALLEIPDAAQGGGLLWRAFHPGFKGRSSPAELQTAQATEQALLAAALGGGKAVAWTLLTALLDSLSKLAKSNRPSEEALFHFHWSLLVKLTEHPEFLDSFLTDATWLRSRIYYSIEPWLMARTYPLAEVTAGRGAELIRFNIDMYLDSLPQFDVIPINLDRIAKHWPESFTEPQLRRLIGFANEHAVSYGDPVYRYLGEDKDYHSRIHDFRFTLKFLAGQRPEVRALLDTRAGDWWQRPRPVRPAPTPAEPNPVQPNAAPPRSPGANPTAPEPPRTPLPPREARDAQERQGAEASLLDLYEVPLPARTTALPPVRVAPPRRTTPKPQGESVPAEPLFELYDVPVPGTTRPRGVVEAAGRPVARTDPRLNPVRLSLIEDWAWPPPPSDADYLRISVGRQGLKQAAFPVFEGQEFVIAVDPADPTSPRLRLRFADKLLRVIEANAGVRSYREDGSKLPVPPNHLVEATSTLDLGGYRVRLVHVERRLEMDEQP